MIEAEALSPTANQSQRSLSQTWSAELSSSVLVQQGPGNFLNDATIRPYQYYDLTSTEIRCIQLEGERDCHLGRLRVHERSEGGFIALSYAWGSPAPDAFRKVYITKDDNINESYVPLTENLDNALSDLKQSTLEPKIFFIDQISINQHDNDEKSTQVAGMGDVYRSANQVVTYLGPAQEGDDRAIELLERIAEHFGPWYKDLCQNGHLTEDLIDQYIRRGKIPGDLHQFQISEAEVANLRLLEHLVYNSGWTQRLWMTQETLLNKRLVFLRGSKLIPSQSVLMLPIIQALGLLSELPKPLQPMFGHAISLSFTYHQFHDKQLTRSLLLLVDTYGRSFACREPKDKIYALLGLARDNWSIVPRYHDAEVVDVFTELCEKSIVKTKTLRIFNYVWAVESGCPTNSWPIWVPTFQLYSPGAALNNLASGSTIPKVAADSNKHELTVKGQQIAQVEDVLGVFDETSSPLTNLLPFKSLVSSIELIGKAQAYLEARKLPDAERVLCYTLTGRTASSSPLLTDDLWYAVAGHAFVVALDALKRTRDSHDPKSEHVIVSTAYLTDGVAQLADALLSRIDLTRRALCVSKDGQLLMAPSAVQTGDIVTIFPGGGEAYALRPVKEDVYNLLGPAFMHGYMCAEILHDEEWEDELRTTIVQMLHGQDFHFEANAAIAGPDIKQIVRHKIRTYISLFTGVLFVSRKTFLSAFSTPGGGEELHAAARSFITSTVDQQRSIICNAITRGPFDVHVNTFWRENWWATIELMIEQNVLSRAPMWMQRLQPFKLR